MADAKRDNNQVTTLLGVSSVDGVTPVVLWADPTTHRLLVSAAPGALSGLTDVSLTSVAQGDILYYDGTDWVNLPAGTSGYFLKTQGAGANPTWAEVQTAITGADTRVMFFDGANTPAGDAGFTYNKTTDAVSANGGFLPISNDTGALGSATLSFSDLFLASGGVINFGNGEVTLTAAANSITLAGGDLALGANNLTMTGSVGATGARVTKVWATDVEITNLPTIGGSTLKSALSLVKGDVGLGNVDNTSDANKPVSTATQTALDLKAPLASPTFTGTVVLPTVTAGGVITLQENAAIALDPAGSADGKYSGITITGVAGYAQAFGDLVYLAVADSRWELADADAATTADRMLAMVVVAGGSDGAACTLLLIGVIRADAKFPALTVGAAVYVGETAGAIQVAIPTGADNVIRRVGYALTADEIYFNPSMDSQTTVA